MEQQPQNFSASDILNTFRDNNAKIMQAMLEMDKCIVILHNTVIQKDKEIEDWKMAVKKLSEAAPKNE